MQNCAGGVLHCLPCKSLHVIPKTEIQNFCNPLRRQAEGRADFPIVDNAELRARGVLHCLQYKSRDVIPKTEFKIFCDPLRRPKDAPTFILWAMQNCARARSSALFTMQKPTCNSKNRIQKFCDPLRRPKDVSTFLLRTMRNCAGGVLHCLQYKSRQVIPKTEFKVSATL